MTIIEDLKGSRVLCFGISPGYNRQQFLKRLEEVGVDLTILSFPGEKLLIRHPFKLVPVDEETLDDTLSSLSKEMFDCAVTYSEFRIITLSESTKRLSLRNQPLSQDAAEASRDKGLMKRIFAAAGVPTAEFKLWSSQDELEEALDALNLHNKDYILKPRLGTTSEGVYRAGVSTSIEKAIDEFYALCRKGAESRLYAPLLLPPPFLVERYIDRFGIPVELAVEGYVSDGQAHITMVSEKVDMVRSGLFLENKYVSPPKSTFVIEDLDKICQIAKKAVKSLGITNSVYHLEMRYDDDDLKVLEIAARPGGGLISTSSKIRVGVDPLLQHLLLNLGRTPQQPVDTGVATCFGTLFYQNGFDVTKLGQVSDYLAQPERELFHEVRLDPETRKNPIQDWLVAFGVTGNSPQESYGHFYQTMDLITARLRR